MKDDVREIEARLESLADTPELATERIDLMIKLAGRLFNADAERATAVNREIRERAQRAGYAEGLAHSTRIEGLLRYQAADLPQALEVLDMAGAQARGLGDKRLLMSIYKTYADAWGLMGDTARSGEYAALFAAAESDLRSQGIGGQDGPASDA